METPIMFAVVILAARWVVRRLGIPPSPSRRLAVGVVALGLLLVAEFTVVLWIRGFTIGEFLTSRDPVAGAVYAMMLVVFAVMPLLVARN
jgi:hypothetical protein